MNVAVTLTYNTQMTMRGPREWPSPANGDNSKVSWPLKVDCTPKFVLKQPVTISKDILRTVCAIRGEIHADLSTTAAFSDCCFEDPDNSWLELSLTDTDHVLEKIEGCFGKCASDISVSLKCLNTCINFTDFSRQGYNIKCTSQKFPSDLMQRIVFDSIDPDNFKATIVEAWAM